MTKQTEALHKALKVLNCLNNDRVYETAWVKGAINACEEALEQPTQEPVAWMAKDEDCTDCIVWKKDDEHVIPLYTHPKEWQRISQYEIKDISDALGFQNKDDLYEFARAIEAKLKEKNG